MLMPQPCGPFSVPALIPANSWGYSGIDLPLTRKKHIAIIQRATVEENRTESYFHLEPQMPYRGTNGSGQCTLCFNPQPAPSADRLRPGGEEPGGLSPP
jgi:hypothetical protein